MDRHLIAYYIGIAIVFITHTSTLIAPGKPMTSMRTHAIVNLVAGALIAYYFMHKEGFIQF
jgi:hypothetical protein